MKLRTIWTMPSCTLRERLSRTAEVAWRGAAHRMPRRLAYWSFIDTGVRHIQSDEVVPEVPFSVILQRASVGVER